MKNRVIFGLLSAVTLAGFSSHLLLKKVNPELPVKPIQQASAGLEIMLDPETGEMLTDPEKITELKAAQKAPEAAKDQRMVMTEMDNGALKIDLGKRFIRPLTTSVDDNGELHEQGHTELQTRESK